MFVWVSVSSDYTYHDWFTMHDDSHVKALPAEADFNTGAECHVLLSLFFSSSSKADMHTFTNWQVLAENRKKTICPLLTQSDLLLVTRELIGWAVVKPVCFTRKRSNSANSRVRLNWVFFSLSFGCIGFCGQIVVSTVSHREISLGPQCNCHEL